MIRHIVLLRARTDVTEAQIAAIFSDLHALGTTLPGIVSVHAGRSESPEQLERDYMHGFTVDFTDSAALLTYLDHPYHKRLGAALVAAADGGIDGLLVFDLPI